MSTPRRSVRRPAVAGLFYPADDGHCARAAAQLVRPSVVPGVAQRRWIGGIVPHAGWVCSGAIAGEAIGTIRDAIGGNGVDVVIVFAAVHTPLYLDVAAMPTHDAWHVPGGDADIAGELSARLEEDSSGLFRPDDRFHEQEHAVEVELPLVRHAWPAATVLPVETPLTDDAVQIGIRAARAARAAKLRAVYLASSDLTHYGPAYQFAPAGVGPAGLEWALENDRRVLSVVTEMSPERVVPTVRQTQSACGGGAIAAMLAACREEGAAEARVLRHANSYEVLRDVAPHQRPDNAVGYAAVVVGGGSPSGGGS